MAAEPEGTLVLTVNGEAETFRRMPLVRIHAIEGGFLWAAWGLN